MSRRETWTVFAASLAVYLGVGLTLSLRYGYLLGDALARTSAAQAVLFSRDPHVSAIGYIFTPLTALAQLPLVAFSSWLPAITRWNISAIAVSALFMAGATVMIYGICRDRGLTKPYSSIIAAVFALNPMIVFFGANGMSEAPFLFFACWAARRLIRWVHTDDVHDLVFAGIALALAYLTRYDAVAAIAATTFLVAGVTVMRQGRAKWRTMRRRALLDAVLVAGPGFSAFVVWTATSWLITGEALAQLSSNYGNAAILEQSGGGATGTLLGNTAFVVTAIVVLGPTLLIAGPVAAVLAHRRRDLEFLVAPVMFGSVLAFQAFSYITGSTFGFLRFYICAIPLAAIVVVQIFAPQGNPETRRTGKFHRSRSEHATAKTGVSAALVALSVGGMMVTGWAMLQPSLSAQQYALRYLFDENPSADADALAARRIIDSFSTERELAAYLDSQNLPEGSILVDTVYGFAVVAASSRPDQFIVPSDQDFTTILNDPAAAGVQYLLTVPNSGRGESDAINRRYPSIYDNGALEFSFVFEAPNDGADQPDWRLYEV